MVPTSSPDLYQAARHGAACLDRSERGRLVVTGTDRARYLQGLLTNDIVALKAGEGCYAAYLTPQGRMIADLLIYELGDALLLTLPGRVKTDVLAKLDQFIFSEDVKLGDVTETFAQIAVVGPRAGAVIASALPGVSADALARLGTHGNLRTTDSDPAIVTRVDDVGEPGYEIFVSRAQQERCGGALVAAGAVVLDPETALVLRVEAGIPQFGPDMDEDTIPLEAGIESRAISFSKGCYVGQEVIIRVMHRGHGRVARKLVGLVLNAEKAPLPGTLVRAGEREAGHVTSSVVSRGLGRPIALAYLHRDFLETGTPVDVDGAPAVVTALPFVARSG